MIRLSIAVALVAVFCPPDARGQSSEPKPTEGLPVTDPLVIAKCSTCHKKDDKGNLSRISWERTTPEGWEEVIKRMVRLNGLTLTPDEARSIIKSLSASHGLAPEEAKPVAYMPEHRIVDEAYPSEVIHSACASCHPFGRVASFRRSPEEWKLLVDMHEALYPVTDLTAFHRRRSPGAAAPGDNSATPAGPPPPQPVDQAIEYLTKTYPLETPEWAAWRARSRPPKLAGKWLASAHIAGKGAYWGEVNIGAGAAPDEFTTTIRLEPIGGGPVIERSGKVAVFNGYAWRGRSTGAASGSAPGDIPAEMRESMMIDPDQSQAQGRWFWGSYGEFGVDVKLWKATGVASIVGLDRPSLKAGSQTQRIRIVGDSFPAQLSPADVDFGSGVSIRRVVSHTPREVVVEVDVAANAINGRRDISVGQAVLPNAIAVYDRIDSIKVIPGTSIARLGGASQRPKGYQQFEVMAYNRGADGKPGTADDVELGPVEVAWSMEEFYETFGDDDKEFVGTLNPSGLFTPALDGPNPQRKQMRNNYGTVWVVATAKSEKDQNGRPLSARSYLVVSVPLFIIWDQEVAP